MNYRGALEMPEILWQCSKWLGEARTILNDQSRQASSNRGTKGNLRADHIGVAAEIMTIHWCFMTKRRIEFKPMVMERPSGRRDFVIEGETVDTKGQVIGQGPFRINQRAHGGKRSSYYCLWGLDPVRGAAHLWVVSHQLVDTWEVDPGPKNAPFYCHEIPEVPA